MPEAQAIAWAAACQCADFFFKCIDFGAKNKLLAIQISMDGFENFLADGGILSFEIEKRERFGHRYLLSINAMI